METKKEKSNSFDLGSSNVRKTFLTILIPTIVAQLIAGTFIVFDTFFVSRGFHEGMVFQGIGGELFNPSSYSSLGPAAISYAMPYTFFIIGIGILIGAGLASVMTKQLANGDKEGYQKSMNSYAPLSIIFGFIVMIVILTFSKFFVWLGSGFQKDYLEAWFNNPLVKDSWSLGVADDGTIDYVQMYSAVNGHILSQASWYLRIQALGAIPYIYMVGGVVMLRVQGKAQYATAFSAVGLVTNILLDFVFIIVLKMNIVGAAIATVVGQIATASIYYWFFNRRAEVKATKFDWSNSLKIVGDVSKSGTSIMMLQVITGISLIIFTFSIGVTNYGEMYKVTNYTSVFQGYNSLFIFLNLVVVGIAQSMAPIVTYNKEKSNIDNVKKARNIGFTFTLVFAIVVMVFVEIFAQQVISLFYTVDGSTYDYITTGYFGNSGVITEGAIATNGMGVAKLIVRILFITFPLAMFLSISGTYLQSLGNDKDSSIIMFGKPIILLPIVLLFGFAFSDLLTSNFEFVYSGGELPSAILPTAQLGMFLALPIIDVIFTLLTIYFLIRSQKELAN